MKKLTVMLLVMTLVFGLAACGNASEKGSTVTETQAQSAEDTGAGNAELNKLYEKEMPLLRNIRNCGIRFLITLTKQSCRRRRTKLWNVSGDTAGSCEGPVFGGRPEKAG